ncbi:UDP-N-acetylglucosamine 1-carboxyvinyltransferase [Clostridium formicaceticum]|jgi:UDP-N-acetylglucosamine 1-carboxyvinyltransferase|uniref:UDP-N-acetylglucosamine 1-carboxyvinyltransferase n=1 Tax=Clostridium formicaceticum TaxID=1497 RepID=A0AAC9RMH5_9CLOT|nr:UDP-N-acetylglucosamine 1-carboxyvinyltransferase [Clostridium formicaceticum]AOY75330.1 UDP-N-acetylglucosamine 1-carboxyvinyltransferase [Clostridium formicaceticum]ARE89779.1 UDP-N-acetylglucosamine 1-carboxyvinyltransferase 2 [Clostridium formicaceticum]
MEKLIIEGGKKLQGKVEVSGFKNAAVAIIPATVLAADVCTIENLPNISDVEILSKLLVDLGAKVVKKEPRTLEIDTREVSNCFIDYESAKDLRASYYFLGAALGRFKKARVVYPGGCCIGNRPIDQHVKGFEAMGAKVHIEHGIISVEAEKLVGAEIYLDVASVGATINIMLAATMAEGVTVIENAAKEPHIVDVANFLNCMGAKVRGAGTDTIKIQGVKRLGGCQHSVIPDQIEAGTYMIAAAATGGDVLINNVIPKHLEAITAKLREMGVEVIENGESLRVRAMHPLKNVNIKTLVYPGFPTDLQQPMSSLLTIAKGTGVITETIFEGRFKHVDELKRMGANIKVEGRVAIIQGVKKLMGAKVAASDLRAGAALIVAALMAEGETEIENVHYIYRGYDQICEKFTTLGAKISKTY